MRNWFLSYNSRDISLMHAFEAALRTKDAGASVFFAPKSLRAGGFWLPELFRAIDESTGFILLVGENGVGPWQEVEYYQAFDRHVKDRNYPVILVLLQGAKSPGLHGLGLVHWIVAADPASEDCLAKVLNAALGGDGGRTELWRHTAPYRGLLAMRESDTDFFFGRNAETAEVIHSLATAPDRLALLIGNSGVGKSSIAQAGVLAAFARQAWPAGGAADRDWPLPFRESRRWCVLKLRPGAEPLRALVEPFMRAWQLEAVDPRRAELLSSWSDRLLAGKVSLRDLIDATQARCREELRQTEPPKFLIYIDQGEELYTRADEVQRRRFSEALARGLGDERLHAMMSLRADFTGELQKDEALYAVHKRIDAPPLWMDGLREVVSRPAAILAAHFDDDELPEQIATRAYEESGRDAGALPLLSYTLDDMWTRMVERGDGVLRLPVAAVDLGGVLVRRADGFLDLNPDSVDLLRGILTLKLADVRADGEPTRRRAARAEFSDAEWRLVDELSSHPYRLLAVTSTPAGEVQAEVAHEAIFRRWDRLKEWIAEAREFLIWKSGLETSRRAWKDAPENSRSEALLMGFGLAEARKWRASHAADLPPDDLDFIDLSIARENRNLALERRKRNFIYGLGACVIVVLLGWLNEATLAPWVSFLTREQYVKYTNFRPYQRTPNARTPESLRALKDGEAFRECARDCPEMVVIPGGEFTIGSDDKDPNADKDRQSDEGPPQHLSIRRFAVSKNDVTNAEWNVCVSAGACAPISAQRALMEADKPVINVTWDEARRYAAFMSRMANSARGGDYRLLSEAEWEYSARGGAKTEYPWGDKIFESENEGNANCKGCGGEWGGGDKGTSPVGTFKPNGFGLNDMAGNVYQWVEDCYHDSYDGIPNDGTHWRTKDCGSRVVRGGSWLDGPQALRSAVRGRDSTGIRDFGLGFRVGRTLTP